MIQYAKEGEDGKVLCSLCNGYGAGISYNKDDWAGVHFRLKHWERYCEMRGILPESTGKLPSIESYFISRSTSSLKPPTQLVSSQVSPAIWITLKDITSDWPIHEDWHIRDMRDASQSQSPRDPGGLVLIRRFVVIQEGLESCLCLGIHTYVFPLLNYLTI